MLLRLIHKFFFGIAACADDAATGNPNGIKTRLANDVSTFFNNGKPSAINGLRDPAGTRRPKDVP